MQEQSTETLDLESLTRLFTVSRSVAATLIRTLMDIFLSIETSGIELIPAEGPAILVCNHADYIDVPIQAVYSPRELIFLGRQEQMEPSREVSDFLYSQGSPLNLPGLTHIRPLIERVIRAFSMAQETQFKEWGAFPVVRERKGSRDSAEYYRELEECIVGLLGQGKLVSIFPEGVPTQTGLVGPFNSLAARLALRTQVPVIPAGISGTYQFLTRASLFSGRMFKNKIQFNIGHPIMPKDFPEGLDKRAVKELTSTLEKQVYALTLHSERRRHARGSARLL